MLFAQTLERVQEVRQLASSYALYLLLARYGSAQVDIARRHAVRRLLTIGDNRS